MGDSPSNHFKENISIEQKPLTYKISIPLNTTIEVEVDGGGPLTYSDIINSITNVDLKEAALHLSTNDIYSSLIRALAKDTLTIESATA